MSSNKLEQETDDPKTSSPEDTAKEGAVGGAGDDRESLSSKSNSDDDSSVDAIRRYFAEKLGFLDSDDTPATEAVKTPKVLEDVSFESVIKYITEGKCSKIITMAGAGISTSAGIPDFRSPGSGLYHNLQKYNLPDPQAIFDIDFFKKNPKPFFALAKELYPGSFKPTVCHYFVRLLQEKGVLLRHYTQNIDTLERVAGLPSDAIVEAHGTFHTSHCMMCYKEYTLEWMKERIFADITPTCECGGVIKPDIIFFGENLPSRFYQLMDADFPNCDLLIILGSSLAVQPFASLIDKVPKTCPRLLINREKCGQRDRLMKLLGMGSGMDFDLDGNVRDVAWLGDCDVGCQLLADKLGWGDELRALVKSQHEKIDKQTEEEKRAAADKTNASSNTES